MNWIEKLKKYDRWGYQGAEPDLVDVPVPVFDAMVAVIEVAESLKSRRQLDCMIVDSNDWVRLTDAVICLRLKVEKLK